MAIHGGAELVMQAKAIAELVMQAKANEVELFAPVAALKRSLACSYPDGVPTAGMLGELDVPVWLRIR